jgi:hypothetical protein
MDRLTKYESVEHCLESLRQYVMCKADATMLTFYWPDEPPHESAKYYPRTNYSFKQKCVNWEKFHEWGKSNSFQLSPNTIFHPVYGMILLPKNEGTCV